MNDVWSNLIDDPLQLEEASRRCKGAGPVLINGEMLNARILQKAEEGAARTSKSD
jgi:hypothetical protein